MSSTMTIVLVVVVVLAVIALALLLTTGMRGRRSHQLRDRFGPEYDRTVERTGDRRQAERELEDRVRRHDELPIRDLEPAARERYAEGWQAVQIRFVDDPRGAVAAADQLLISVMRDRGYPAESFEQQVADVSVDHPKGADAYRRGREVLANARGQVATDDLRQGMVLYRELFVELVGEIGPPRQEAGGETRATGSHREVS
jgi:FtsZ-interacting cell division protein ZipA